MKTFKLSTSSWFQNEIENNSNISLEYEKLQNLLPVSLKIISNLKLDDIEVELIDKGFESFTVDLEIDKDDYDIKLQSFMKDNETLLMTKLEKFINDGIKKYKKLQIHTLCSSISIIKETDFNARMLLRSNIKFE
jgi:hypothetical protein